MAQQHPHGGPHGEPDGEELHMLASLERLIIQLAMALTAVPKTFILALIYPRALTVHLNLPDDGKSRPVVKDGLLAPGLYSVVMMVASALIMAGSLSDLSESGQSESTVFGPEQAAVIARSLESGETAAVIAALVPIFLQFVITGIYTRPLALFVGRWFNTRARFGAAAYVVSTILACVFVGASVFYKPDAPDEDLSLLNLVMTIFMLGYVAASYASILRGPLGAPVLVWWRALIGGVLALAAFLLAITTIALAGSLAG